MSNKGRTLVVGDIHGSAKALEQVLERCNFDYNKDKLIQLGDVADGWGETSECVDILLDIKQRSNKENNPVFIRGNHDVWVYDWLLYGDLPIVWTEQGGKATLENYIKTGMFMYSEHINFWCKEQVDWHLDDSNRLYIHAGWAYREGEFPASAKYPVNAGTIAKECHWDRTLLSGAKSGKTQGLNALKEFKEVFIGHTATKSSLPENYLNLWNLDSGCGWHGRLTIMDVDTKEYWQSDFCKELYPNEIGRG